MEPKAASSAISLIACPRPFSVDRITTTIEAGTTIANALRAIGLKISGLHARVFIDDRLVPYAEWEYATPEAGQLVTVRVIPTGGGGGKDGLRLIALLAVAALALAAPYAVAAFAPGWGLIGSWAGAALSATVAIAGSLAVNGRIPEPLPRRLPRPIENGGEAAA